MSPKSNGTQERRLCEDRSRDGSGVASRRGPPGPTKSRKRQEQSPLQQEHGSTNTLIWTAHLQNCERIRACHVQPPILWLFAVAATAKLSSSLFNTLEGSKQMFVVELQAYSVHHSPASMDSYMYFSLKCFLFNINFALVIYPG